VSSEHGHRRLPNILPRLPRSSSKDPLQGSSPKNTDGEDMRQDDHKKKKRKKHKDTCTKAHTNEKEKDELVEQTQPQVTNDVTEVSQF